MLETLVLGLFGLFVLGTAGVGLVYLVGARRERDRLLLILGALKVAVAAAFLVGLALEPLRSLALVMAMLLIVVQALLGREARERLDRPSG